jgi:F0F1-type ATP synthase assembly protein I
MTSYRDIFYPGEVLMPHGPPDSKDVGYYFSLAQVGLEMVVPIGVGALLDHRFSWRPWGVVVGAVLGLIVGLVHLVALLNRREKTNSNKPKRDTR